MAVVSDFSLFVLGLGVACNGLRFIRYVVSFFSWEIRSEGCYDIMEGYGSES